MAFTDKDDAITKMNSNIATAIEPHLTPVGSSNRVRATNLKSWLTEFLNWVFPVTGSDLKGKTPIITSAGTDYASISWIQVVPIGTVMPWAGSSVTPPDGFLFCDGTTKSTATYPELEATLGANYGAAPVGNFRLPNMSGNTPLGFDTTSPTTPTSLPAPNSTNYGKVGNTGGAQQTALNTSNLPSHFHNDGSLSTDSKGNHAHEFLFSGDSILDSSSIYPVLRQNPDIHLPSFYSAENRKAGMQNAGSHTHAISGNTGSTGNNVPHENRTPYVVMKYIIKT